jgi:uncharacterized protein
MIRMLILAFAILAGTPAPAQTYPPLSGRVVDSADLLTPQQEQDLDARLEAVQRASSRQLVVATFPDLQGRTIEEFGVGLGRHWQIGQSEANNGVLLIVAVAEKRMRIEVGYGLEGILTDALSGRIIRDVITPHFRRDPPDYAGGIFAGTDAIIAQLQAPPEAAERATLEAQQAENRRRESRSDDDGSIVPLIFWGAVLLFIILPAFGAGLTGRRYRGRGRRGVSIWGPGRGRRGGSGAGWFIAGMAIDGLLRGGRGGGGSWGSGGSSWGGGGGGFSGGGGSFGGGGASGGW